MAALLCRYLAKLGCSTSTAGSGYFVSLGRLQSFAAPMGLIARLALPAAAAARNLRRCIVPHFVPRRAHADSYDYYATRMRIILAGFEGQDSGIKMRSGNQHPGVISWDPGRGRRWKRRHAGSRIFRERAIDHDERVPGVVGRGLFGPLLSARDEPKCRMRLGAPFFHVELHSKTAGCRLPCFED